MKIILCLAALLSTFPVYAQEKMDSFLKQASMNRPEEFSYQLEIKTKSSTSVYQGVAKADKWKILGTHNGIKTTILHNANGTIAYSKSLAVKDDNFPDYTAINRILSEMKIGKETVISGEKCRLFYTENEKYCVSEKYGITLFTHTPNETVTISNVKIEAIKESEFDKPNQKPILDLSNPLKFGI